MSSVPCCSRGLVLRRRLAAGTLSVSCSRGHAAAPAGGDQREPGRGHGGWGADVATGTGADGPGPARGARPGLPLPPGQQRGGEGHPHPSGRRCRRRSGAARRAEQAAVWSGDGAAALAACFLALARPKLQQRGRPCLAPAGRVPPPLAQRAGGGVVHGASPRHANQPDGTHSVPAVLCQWWR